jgi:hypothetical protein
MHLSMSTFRQVNEFTLLPLQCGKGAASSGHGCGATQVDLLISLPATSARNFLLTKK